MIELLDWLYMEIRKLAISLKYWFLVHFTVAIFQY